MDDRKRIYYKTKAEIDKSAHGARVHRYEWTGPGWYYVKEYQQRCSRGCCYDDVFDAISPQDVVEEISYKMRELAELLRKVREDIKECTAHETPK